MAYRWIRLKIGPPEYLWHTTYIWERKHTGSTCPLSTSGLYIKYTMYISIGRLWRPHPSLFIDKYYHYRLYTNNQLIHTCTHPPPYMSVRQRIWNCSMFRRRISIKTIDLCHLFDCLLENAIFMSTCIFKSRKFLDQCNFLFNIFLYACKIFIRKDTFSS